MQGAMAFQKGLGCVHSLSHSLGGVDPRLHHGTLNAMFLPAVVTLQRRRPNRCRRTGAWSAWPAPWAWQRPATSPKPSRDMNARLGLPTGLAAMGVQPRRDHVRRRHQGALADHCHKTNPG
jgi:4-hydroxybutyrate dehydrogenase